MSADGDKDDVRRFVDSYPLLKVSELERMMPANDTEDEEEGRMFQNLCKLRTLIQARDRRRRKQKRDEERRRQERAEQERIERDREEAADHRDDVDWLAARIRSLGWDVTVTEHREQAEGGETGNK